MDLGLRMLCPSCGGWAWDRPRMENAAVPVAVLKWSGRDGQRINDAGSQLRWVGQDGPRMENAASQLRKGGPGMDLGWRMILSQLQF